MDEFERGAAHAREARSPGAYRATLAHLRRRAAARGPLRGLDASARREELEELRRELEDELGAAGPGARPDRDAPGPRELVHRARARARRADRAAARLPPADARRHRRRGQDTVGARARTPRRARVPRRSRVRGAGRGPGGEPGRERGRRRVRSGDAPRTLAVGGGRRVPGSATCAAGARQLRAPARRQRVAVRRAAAGGPRADDPRHHPRAAARRRRGRVPGAFAGDPGSRARRMRPRS